MPSSELGPTDNAAAEKPRIDDRGGSPERAKSAPALPEAIQQVKPLPRRIATPVVILHTISFHPDRLSNVGNRQPRGEVIGDIAGGRPRCVALRQCPDRSDGLDPNALARCLDDLSNVRLVRGEDDVIAPSRGAFDHRHVDHVSVIGSAS